MAFSVSHSIRILSLVSGWGGTTRWLSLSLTALGFCHWCRVGVVPQHGFLNLSTLSKLVSGWGGARVPGEIKRSRDLRGGRWSWTLKLAQKRS